MTPAFGRLARAFGRRFFAGFRLEEGDAERLREIETRGAAVYVMRYSSRLDYFLFNWLFLREGLRLSGFANGIRFYYYRPLSQALRLGLRGLWSWLRRGPRRMREVRLDQARAMVRAAGSLFLFLRTDKIRSRLQATREGALEKGHSEQDYLREVVRVCQQESRPVYLIPLALFWRKGPRPRRRFLNLFYGAPERPTDTGKVLSFLWNYRNLAVRVGTPIDLGGFLEEQRGEAPERLVRKVRRSLLIFLRREEKPVAGPALRPRARIEELVLADPEVKGAMEELAVSGRRSPARIRRRAQRMLREIAAHPSPTMLAVLDVLVGRIFARLFERIEVHGLDRIAEAAKLHPLVLLPCHRSHFDYLLLSWLFYERHLVPPLVAAGINLSFWPLGPIFRRAGGFFMRRSFEGDPLYAAVFRGYVQQLIKDGVPQEFFIEGTRSRTGRTLQPRFGLLRMVLDAYARGVRRDVLLVPVGFAYQRLVEESSMTEERRGGGKTAETLVALVRARRVLRERYGSVTVRFGEPISLAAAVGEQRHLFTSEAEADVRARRELTAQLGLEVCRRINDLIAAVWTAVASTALLGAPTRGVPEAVFLERCRELVSLLQRLRLPVDMGLVRMLEAGNREALLRFLEGRGLARVTQGPREAVVWFEERMRDALDYYRSTLLAALVFPGAVGLALAEPRTASELYRRAGELLDLLRFEAIVAEGEERERRLRAVVDHFSARGWVGEQEGRLVATEKGAEWLAFFAGQLRPSLEAYRALVDTVLELGGTGTRRLIEQEARAAHERHLLVGTAGFPEGAAPALLADGLGLLLEEEILVSDGQPRRADAELRPGPHWRRLSDLGARLADALPSR
jgi:glycerol-3-phosphate O-acyltransferase